MKEFEGTNGKLAVLYADTGTIIVNDDGECIASLGGYATNKPEDEANAKLFAAAPELLEALKDMLSGWKYIREQHGDLYGVGWDRAEQKATAAIAKALGSNG